MEALTPKVVEAVEALEEKAGQRAASFFQKLAEKLGRVSGKQIAISAGSGALVALLLVPLLSAAHAFAAPAARPLVVIVPAMADRTILLHGCGSSPGSLLAMSEWGEKRAG